MQTPSNTHNDQDEGKKSIPSLVWQFFASMKTAVLLILLLAAASVVGTAVGQGGDVHSGSAWKVVIFRTLGLKDVFHSAWYEALLALMGVNLAVCSIHRFGPVWRRTFRPDIALGKEGVQKESESSVFNVRGTTGVVSANVRDALRSRSYRIFEKQTGGETAIYAIHGRAGIWGPYLTHVSLLVIFLGAVFGNVFGFDGFASIAEGENTDACYKMSSADQRIPEEKKLPFRIGLNRFTVECDSKRNPTGYKSNVTFYEGNQAGASKIIDVNHPASYRGFTFLQSDYGLSGLVLKIGRAGGKTAAVNLALNTIDDQGRTYYELTGSPLKEVALGDRKLTILLRDFAPDFVRDERINRSFMPLNPAVRLMVNDRLPEYRGLDAWKTIDWLPLNGHADYKGFEITFDQAVSYSGLRVSANPGLPVVYGGFALLMLGVILSLYVTPRVIRVGITRENEGSKVSISVQSCDGGIQRDFEYLREGVQKSSCC
ncbi:MAG TPA: cytochrome c biogenesis protein ResB [Armatimonadota bacterium]|jgi:cytochrome c biogenesis protein